MQITTERYARCTTGVPVLITRIQLLATAGDYAYRSVFR